MYGVPQTYGFVVMTSPTAYVPIANTFGSTTQSYASVNMAQNQSVSSRGLTPSSVPMFASTINRGMWCVYPVLTTCSTAESRHSMPLFSPQNALGSGCLASNTFCVLRGCAQSPSHPAPGRMKDESSGISDWNPSVSECTCLTNSLHPMICRTNPSFELRGISNAMAMHHRCRL